MEPKTVPNRNATASGNGWNLQSDKMFSFKHSSTINTCSIINQINTSENMAWV